MKSKAGLLDLDAERSAWAELSEQATYPRDWRPVFPEWWKNGAPGRIKLGTLMLLVSRYNFSNCRDWQSL
jgi:hypothetical protein